MGGPIQLSSASPSALPTSRFSRLPAGTRFAAGSPPIHRSHVEMLGQTAITDDDLQGVVVTLRRLERFWMRASDPLQGPGQFAA
jgi:hypothetical protein